MWLSLGSGYYEDGRDIFDDDITDGDDISARDSRKTKASKTAAKAEKEYAAAGFQSIRNMLANMPKKRKRGDGSTSTATIDEDPMMNDFMAELCNDKKSKSGESSSSSFIKKTAGPNFDAMEQLSIDKTKGRKFVEPELKKFKPSYTGNYNGSPSTTYSSLLRKPVDNRSINGSPSISTSKNDTHHSDDNRVRNP